MNEEVKFTPAVMAEVEAAEQALEDAKTFVVTTIPEYEQAGEELKKLSARGKQLEQMRKNLKAPALEQCRRIDEFFKAPQQFVEDAKRAIKKALGAYDAEQKRKREEAERKAAEAARKERERLEREAAKAEEAARKKRAADEARARQLEEEGRAAEAEAKRKVAVEREEAKLRDAEAKREAAAHVPTAPVIQPEQPQVKGISTRQVWQFEITDIRQLPPEYLKADEKAIGGVVRALKDRTNIPGVRVYAEETIAARSA